MTIAPPSTGRLTSQTTVIPDPGDLLTALPKESPLAWVRHGDGLVGWGEAARITLPAGEDRFQAGQALLTDLFDTARIDDPIGVPGSGPVAFGSFTFDPQSAGSVLIVPRVVMGRSDGKSWMTVIGDPNPPATSPSPLQPVHGIHWSDGALSAPAWQQAVAKAVELIDTTGLRKVALARDLYAEATSPFDVRVLLHRLADRYPDCYAFSVGDLVGATPELLVRRFGDRVESLVIAGTTARGTSPEDDKVRGEALMDSAKDRKEHQFSVDMVRDALGPLCRSMHAPQSPELMQLANVIHLTTPFTGRLAANRTVLDVVEALHPTPAVCGTPTMAAMQAIRDLEGMDRRGYAGPVGWVDARGDGEWAIALRCAEISGRRARLIAGCGIVAGSEPTPELAEAQAKFRVMQYALEA